MLLALGIAHALRLTFAGTAGESCAVENGDVSSDDAINLADAVAILGYLFRGNPARLPPLCPRRTGLPHTGQTVCYDDAGEEIPCDSADFPGQDGFYQMGCSGEGRYVDNGDGTVTDTCTGLMWQQNTADVNRDGDVTPPGSAGKQPPDTLTWQEALRYCEALEFAGYSDWRVPNSRELESIVDYGRRDPCIDPVFDAESSDYWTSSSLVPAADAVDTPVHAGFHSFWYGSYMYHAPKFRSFLVRAVRGPP